MAIYSIGDIHGCYKALITLFKHLPYNSDDTFVFLGDYINRGPDSKKVLDWLINFSKKSNSIFIRGNHEILMLSAQVNESRLTEWLNFGGNNTLKSYNANTKSIWENKVPAEHWDFLNETIAYYEVDYFLFVHAGLEPKVPLNEQNHHHLFWKKYEIPLEYDKKTKVICGHTSRKNGEIANFDHTICIDTYAYGGQWLSALNVSTQEYYQANQKGKYRKGQLSIK